MPLLFRHRPRQPTHRTGMCRPWRRAVARRFAVLGSSWESFSCMNNSKDLTLVSRFTGCGQRVLAKIHKNVVIKVPITKEGLKAVKTLTAEGIKTNVTVTFSPLQAMLAAKCGATYISPFVGRLDAVGHIGMDVVRQIKTIYTNYGYKTQVLTAAVRHPTHVLEAALAGSDVA